MDTTPVSLLARLRSPGDDDAWPELIALVNPLLLGWCRRVGLARDDAADLAQDVLAVLVVELRTFEYDPKRSFRAWLKTITLNEFRRRRRRPTMLSLEAAHVAEPAAPETEAVWENEYRFQLILRGFEAIRPYFQPRTWQAAYEVVIRGRPAAEVAAELGFSSNALYVAKCRVLDRLRKELDGMLE